MPILTSRTLAASALLLVGAFGLAGCTAPAAGTNVSTPSAAAPAVDTPSATPDTRAFSYADSGLTLTLVRKSRECFGDSGCVQTFDVQVGLDDPNAVPVDASGSIGYTITGGKDGPIEGTIDITGTSYSQPSAVVQTPKRNSAVTVTTGDITTN